MRPEVKIVEGRMFKPGTNEIVVGRAASRQFAGLTVGSTVKWGENDWQVVGIFDARRQRRRVRDLVRRQGAAAGLPARQQLPVGLRPARARRRLPGAQGRADDRIRSCAVTRDPRARVLRRAVEDAADRSSARSGSSIAGLMGIGAVFGAVNTMYTAVAQPDARDRDAARARVRQLPGRVLGARRSRRAERRSAG